MIDSESSSKIGVEHITRHAGLRGFCLYFIMIFGPIFRYVNVYSDVLIRRGRVRCLYVRNCSENRQVIFLYTSLERENISPP